MSSVSVSDVSGSDSKRLDLDPRSIEAFNYSNSQSVAALSRAVQQYSATDTSNRVTVDGTDRVTIQIPRQAVCADPKSFRLQFRAKIHPAALLYNGLEGLISDMKVSTGDNVELLNKSDMHVTSAIQRLVSWAPAYSEDDDSSGFSKLAPHMIYDSFVKPEVLPRQMANIVDATHFLGEAIIQNDNYIVRSTTAAATAAGAVSILYRVGSTATLGKITSATDGTVAIVAGASIPTVFGSVWPPTADLLKGNEASNLGIGFVWMGRAYFYLGRSDGTLTNTQTCSFTPPLRDAIPAVTGGGMPIRQITYNDLTPMGKIHYQMSSAVGAVVSIPLAHICGMFSPEVSSSFPLFVTNGLSFEFGFTTPLHCCVRQNTAAAALAGGGVAATFTYNLSEFQLTYLAEDVNGTVTHKNLLEQAQRGGLNIVFPDVSPITESGSSSQQSNAGLVISRACQSAKVLYIFLRSPDEHTSALVPHWNPLPWNFQGNCQLSVRYNNIELIPSFVRTDRALYDMSVITNQMSTNPVNMPATFEQWRYRPVICVDLRLINTLHELGRSNGLNVTDKYPIYVDIRWQSAASAITAPTVTSINRHPLETGSYLQTNQLAAMQTGAAAPPAPYIVTTFFENETSLHFKQIGPGGRFVMTRNGVTQQ